MHAPDPSDLALFGKDDTPRIVDVVAVRDGSDRGPATVRLYRRDADMRLVTEDDRVFPFFFLSDAALLDGHPKTYKLQTLGGDAFYRHLVVFNTWRAYYDALRHLDTATESRERRPDEVYRVTSPAQQYLMQTGRTLFKGMDFDDLHRLQLDLEVYSERGFPSADRPADAIVIVALSDNRGWQTAPALEGRRRRGPHPAPRPRRDRRPRPGRDRGAQLPPARHARVDAHRAHPRGGRTGRAGVRGRGHAADNVLHRSLLQRDRCTDRRRTRHRADYDRRPSAPRRLPLRDALDARRRGEEGRLPCRATGGSRWPFRRTASPKTTTTLPGRGVERRTPAGKLEPALDLEHMPRTARLGTRLLRPNVLREGCRPAGGAPCPCSCGCA